MSTNLWLRKALPYRLTNSVPLFQARGLLGESSWEVHQELNKALNQRPARAPANNELSTYGFVDPFPPRAITLAEVNEEPTLEEAIDAPPLARLVRPINNGEFLVVCAEYQYRDLKTQVIKRELKLKTDKIEFEQQRKVYKKERDQLKDEIVQQLLPRAFVLARRTPAIIDTQRGVIWVGSGTAKAAEDLLSTLRECLGSLPIRPYQVKIAPSASFTDWVREGKCPQDFHLLDLALFEDTSEDGGKVGMIRQDLTGEATQMVVAEGKIATKIAIAYQDKVSFVVNDKLQFTSIRFEDLLADQAAQVGGDDAHGQLEASALITGRTLRDMLEELSLNLGGEEIPQGI